MVGLEGGTPNHELDNLFETLEEWNTYLENHVPYFQEPQP